MEIRYTPEVMARIEEARRERVARLAREGGPYDVAPDHVLPGAWIVRDRQLPGIVNIVTADGSCSCQRSRIWGNCPHAARVAELHGETRTQ